MMKTIILAVSLSAMLAVALIGAINIWTDLGDTDLGIHGVLAMIGGIVLSLGLGGGLMFLVFRSETLAPQDDEEFHPRKGNRDRR